MHLQIQNLRVQTALLRKFTRLSVIRSHYSCPKAGTPSVEPKKTKELTGSWFSHCFHLLDIQICIRIMNLLESVEPGNRVVQYRFLYMCMPIRHSHTDCRVPMQSSKRPLLTGAVRSFCPL